MILLFFLPEPFLSANTYPTARLTWFCLTGCCLWYPSQNSVCWLLSCWLWHFLVCVRTRRSLAVPWFPLCASLRTMSAIFAMCMAMAFVFAIFVGGRVTLVTWGLVVCSGTAVNTAYLWLLLPHAFIVNNISVPSHSSVLDWAATKSECAIWNSHWTDRCLHWRICFSLGSRRQSRGQLAAVWGRKEHCEAVTEVKIVGEVEESRIASKQDEGRLGRWRRKCGRR